MGLILLDVAVFGNFVSSETQRKLIERVCVY